MKKSYVFSVLKSIYKKDGDKDNFVSIETNNLDIFSTKESEKLKAPLWNMSKMESRKGKVIKVSGMIIDYDNEQLPKLNKQYEFYYHRTHSNKWRIIIPFDKVYDYTNEQEYEESYIDMLTDIFEPSGYSLTQLFDLDEKKVDKSKIKANSFYFMRQESVSLLHNEGGLFIPLLGSESTVLNVKKDIALKKTPKFIPLEAIDDVDEGKKILLRIKRFYDNYKNNLSWKFIKTKERTCVFDWHDNRSGDLHFNATGNNGHINANIYCHHDTCKEKLDKFMSIYQPDIKINYFTIQYLAAGIIQGIYSIEQIESCGVHDEGSLLDNLKHLTYLPLDSMQDATLIPKVIHENIVINDEDNSMYQYKDGAYQKVNEDALKSIYYGGIGRYANYRNSFKKKFNVRKYIDDMIDFSKGEMIKRFGKLNKTNGIVLNNGILMLNIDGTYSVEPHDKKYFSTIKTDVNYDKSADCPLWKKTLCDYFDSMDSPQVRIIQEYFGYCLTYDRSLEKILFLFGKTRGGKNTIVQTLMSIIPGAQSSMSYLTTIDRRAPFIIGKKVVFVDEALNLKDSYALGELKKMSSTDGIQVRYLCREAYEVENVPKIIIAFDEGTMGDDIKMDKALRGRTLAVKFTKSFLGKENTQLKYQLKQEKAGILNWLLEGYERLYKAKKFTQYCQDADELYNAANEQNLELADFIKTKADEKGIWYAAELLRSYREWSGLSEFEMNQTKFGLMLKRLNLKKSRSGQGYRYDLHDFA